MQSLTKQKNLRRQNKPKCYKPKKAGKTGSMTGPKNDESTGEQQQTAQQQTI